MNLTKVPRAILRVQYQLVRIPLALIENRVAARLRSEAPARLIYERSLGLLDATVGNALGDATLHRQGAALAKRSEDLGRAGSLEATAERTRKRANDELKASREQSVEDQADARARKEQAVEQARVAADERARSAAQSAKERVDATKKQADEVAAKRRESAEAAKRQENQRIQAVEKKATAAAQAKLKDANAKRDEANGKRARANRVEQLADVEKQKRQTERAGKR